MTEQKDLACYYAASLGQTVAYVQILIRIINGLHPEGLPEWAEKIVKDADTLVQEVLHQA